jgi:hypothetical protein
MTIQTNSLAELLKIFPADATVRGFEGGITVNNADGPGEIVMLNDSLPVPEMEAIHLANMLYWNCEAHSHEADLEYQLRQERLKQVRKEYRRPERLKQEWAEGRGCPPMH